MPYFLVANGGIVHAADALDGVLSQFSELTGARITKADPPRAIVDSKGRDIRYEQTALFDEKDGWHVVVDDQIFSFHRFDRPYKYYYVHCTPPLDDYREGYMPECTTLYGHDHPAVAMRVAANATSAQIADALKEVPKMFNLDLAGVPEPLLRLALKNPSAIQDLGPEWSYTTLEMEAHGWIRGPQKNYGILTSTEPHEDQMPFFWLTGYFDKERATRFIRAMSDHWTAEHRIDAHCSVVWGDTALEAASATMKDLEEDINDAYAGDDAMALEESLRLRTRLRDAYLHPTNPEEFFLSHPTAPPALAAEAMWLRRVAM